MTHDAIVVGSGPNGLVAACLLAERGWSVLVLEAQPDVGGAVRSDGDVHPDFVHDTFSAFYPLAAVSSTIRSLGLERHGLRWAHAPAAYGHVTPDGWALVHRDVDITADLLERDCPGDGDAWRELVRQWREVETHAVGALLDPFPPVRHGAALLPGLRRAGGLAFVQTMLTPALDLARTRFAGEAARLLIAGNAAHADIPLEAPGSGLMGVLLSMLAQSYGYPAPVGGAGELSGALHRRLLSLGGEVVTGAEVTEVEVVDGRATGVRTRDGERHGAGRAVLADVSAPALYGGLVAPEHLPRRTLTAMEAFTLDPGTVKVDFALSGPVPWAHEPAYAPGTVHVADSPTEVAESLAQVHAGWVPATPFLLTGQMTTTDPTRSPEGTESFWAYTHVPQEVRGDAGDGGVRGTWDHDDVERFADRVQARLERVAPGFGERVLARRVLGPRELEARNANLIGGSLNGGTSQLHQQLVFRPVPGLGRAETPVRGLFLASAAAHPGGGVHGACGANAARAAVAHHRWSRLTPGRR